MPRTLAGLPAQASAGSGTPVIDAELRMPPEAALLHRLRGNSATEQCALADRRRFSNASAARRQSR